MSLIGAITSVTGALVRSLSPSLCAHHLSGYIIKTRVYSLVGCTLSDAEVAPFVGRLPRGVGWPLLVAFNRHAVRCRAVLSALTHLRLDGASRQPMCRDSAALFT